LQQFGEDWDERRLRAGLFKLTSAPATCGDRSSARKNDFDFGELARLGAIAQSLAAPACTQSGHHSLE
jgi:hypothetical protein